MNALSALSLAFAAMALIGLSMQRHARQAGFGIESRWMRPAAWLLLILSLVAALDAPNWRFAIVEWIGLASGASGLVVLTLYYRPRALASGAAAAALLGGIVGMSLVT